MNRRDILRSLGALALSPLAPPVPVSLSVKTLGVGAVVPNAPSTISAHTYAWAEKLVRAHNKCNLAMLQRHLRLDATTAGLLKTELLKNGIINAQANAYGIHSVVKPLCKSAFLQPQKFFNETLKQSETALNQGLQTTQKFEEISSENSDLIRSPESNQEIVESDCEVSEEQNLTDKDHAIPTSYQGNMKPN